MMQNLDDYRVRCRICDATGLRSTFANSNLCHPCKISERRKYRRARYTPVEDDKRRISGVGKWKNRPSKEGDPSTTRLSSTGCTLTQWDAFMEECKGCCMICGQYKGEDLCIDHDHATSQPRGLVCFKCNTGLGHLGDNEEGLLRALDYLRGRKYHQI